VGPGKIHPHPQQLAEFNEFQMALAVGSTFVPDQADRVTTIIDLAGMSFVPLYRILGLACMIVILSMFVFHNHISCHCFG
jgi:hypothetical protein